MLFNKKGQITIFIIMGLIILSSLAFFVFFETQKEAELELNLLYIQPVKVYVESCIKSIGPFGLFLIGVQGGYIEPSVFSLRTPYSTIGYAYYEGVKILVPLENIASQFSNYIQEQLPSCINDFEALEGHDIEGGKIEAETIFTKDYVRVNVYYPITIKNVAAIATLSDFSVKFPVRFRTIYDVVDTIVNKEEQDPSSIDITYLKETGMNVTIIPVNNSTIIYVIDDPESRLDKPPYTFIFANKFKLEDIGVV